MIDDPFALLAMPHGALPPDEYPLMAAVKRFDPTHSSPLINLLESSDPIISARGLCVFAELGRKGAVVLDTALKLIGHPHKMARNALMDGVMCYPEILNATQASEILTLVSDPFVLVREKVIVFLAHADLVALEGAIASLDDPLPSQHRVGLDVLSAPHSNMQQLFDEAIIREDVWSVYALASIARMARKGALTHAPEYAGDNYEAAGVVHHVKMHIARGDYRRRQGETRATAISHPNLNE